MYLAEHIWSLALLDFITVIFNAFIPAISYVIFG